MKMYHVCYNDPIEKIEIRYGVYYSREDAIEAEKYLMQDYFFVWIEVHDEN